jgi:hypothetical protein
MGLGCEAWGNKKGPAGFSGTREVGRSAFFTAGGSGFGVWMGAWFSAAGDLVHQALFRPAKKVTALSKLFWFLVILLRCLKNRGGRISDDFCALSHSIPPKEFVKRQKSGRQNRKSVMPAPFAGVVKSNLHLLLHRNSPAAALIIHNVFSRPMMPAMARGRCWREEVAAIRLSSLFREFCMHAVDWSGKRLGGFAVDVAAIVANRPRFLAGGGILLVPSGQTISRAACHLSGGSVLPMAHRRSNK